MVRRSRVIEVRSLVRLLFRSAVEERDKPVSLGAKEVGSVQDISGASVVFFISIGVDSVVGFVVKGGGLEACRDWDLVVRRIVISGCMIWSRNRCKINERSESNCGRNLTKTRK